MKEYFMIQMNRKKLIYLFLGFLAVSAVGFLSMYYLIHLKGDLLAQSYLTFMALVTLFTGGMFISLYFEWKLSMIQQEMQKNNNWEYLKNAYKLYKPFQKEISIVGITWETATISNILNIMSDLGLGIIILSWTFAVNVFKTPNFAGILVGCIMFIVTVWIHLVIESQNDIYVKSADVLLKNAGEQMEAKSYEEVIMSNKKVRYPLLYMWVSSLFVGILMLFIGKTGVENQFLILVVFGISNVLFWIFSEGVNKLKIERA